MRNVLRHKLDRNLLMIRKYLKGDNGGTKQLLERSLQTCATRQNEEESQDTRDRRTVRTQYGITTGQETDLMDSAYHTTGRRVLMQVLGDSVAAEGRGSERYNETAVDRWFHVHERRVRVEKVMVNSNVVRTRDRRSTLRFRSNRQHK